MRLYYNDYSDKQQRTHESEVQVMNRLKRELMDRGIIYDCENESGYDPYEAEEVLVDVTADFIITAFFCNVLEPQYHLYDRHFNYIGEQSTRREADFFGMKATNPWSVSLAQ